MIDIWFIYIVNHYEKSTITINHLVGGAITILKNMKVNGKDDKPYMKGEKNVPNHQPAKSSLAVLWSNWEQ